MIPIERTSRFIRADAVTDIAIEMGLERIRIVTQEQWDNSRAFILTFGSPAYRFTAVINPAWEPDEVRAEIDKVRHPPVPVKAEQRKRRTTARAV